MLALLKQTQSWSPELLQCLPEELHFFLDPSFYDWAPVFLFAILACLWVLYFFFLRGRRLFHPGPGPWMNLWRVIVYFYSLCFVGTVPYGITLMWQESFSIRTSMASIVGPDEDEWAVGQTMAVIVVAGIYVDFAFSFWGADWR